MKLTMQNRSTKSMSMSLSDELQRRMHHKFLSLVPCETFPSHIVHPLHEAEISGVLGVVLLAVFKLADWNRL